MADVRDLLRSGEIRVPGSIGVNWVLEPSTNYYLRRYGITGLGTADRLGLRAGHAVYVDWLGRESRLLAEYAAYPVARYPLAGMLLALPSRDADPPDSQL
jgi:hypothetical protein